MGEHVVQPPMPQGYEFTLCGGPADAVVVTLDPRLPEYHVLGENGRVGRYYANSFAACDARKLHWKGWLSTP